MSSNNIRWAPVGSFRCSGEARGSAAPYTKSLIFYVHLPTNICYLFYFLLLNSPVSFNPTPLVLEGMEHWLWGLHPGAPSLFPFLSRAGSPPAYCACRHWASRTRAVSLLTGGLVPQLALYLIKRNPPKRSIVIFCCKALRCALFTNEAQVCLVAARCRCCRMQGRKDQVQEESCV